MDISTQLVKIMEGRVLKPDVRNWTPYPCKTSSCCATSWSRSSWRRGGSETRPCWRRCGRSPGRSSSLPTWRVMPMTTIPFRSARGRPSPSLTWWPTWPRRWSWGAPTVCWRSEPVQGMLPRCSAGSWPKSIPSSGSQPWRPLPGSAWAVSVTPMSPSMWVTGAWDGPSTHPTTPS